MALPDGRFRSPRARPTLAQRLRRTASPVPRTESSGDQGLQVLHVLLFAAGVTLFLAGLVVVVGLSGGSPLVLGSTNATAGTTADTTATTTTAPSTTTDAPAATTTSPSTTTASPTTTTSTSTTSTSTPTTTTSPTTTTTSTTTTATSTTTTTREGIVDAEVLGFFPDHDSYAEGETVVAQVRVENTGTTTHTFFVGYSVYGPDGVERHNDGTTGKTVTLAPGERRTVTVEWEVESDAPAGAYDAQTIVWKESDRADLHTRLDGAVVENAFWVEASATTGDDDG